MSQANLETLKHLVRQALLFGLPLAIQAIAGQNGQWWLLAGAVLSAVDKWLHSNDSVAVNGLVPF